MGNNLQWTQADLDRINKTNTEVVKKPHKFHAQKVEIGDKKFDSKREYYMYQCLKKWGIVFKEKEKMVLMLGFTYNGEKVREIAIIPDFSIYTQTGELIAIVDVKGIETPDFKLKWKMLKRKFYIDGVIAEMFLPKSHKECDNVILEIIGKIFTNK